MKKTLKVLNDMVEMGLIEQYAIGGGIAVLYYTEPVLTYDLDVFCLLPVDKSELITLSPIYEYLQKKGYKKDGEHIIIEGIPVQMIPAYNEIIEEALNEAAEVKYQQIKTRIVRVEHLLVIMLQTYRPKDRERILLLLDETQIDMLYLENVLKRHGLMKKWLTFRMRYNEK
ncbi:MAG: hypothetical protein KKC23_07025 [Proteobacteria bacterium]|nr:hypothetical protein [Pseudomonadota bacterium]